MSSMIWPLHAGEALQLQFDDGLRLLLGEREPGDQRIASLAWGFDGADQLDDLIYIVECLLEAQQNVLARSGLAQLVVGAAPHDIQAVIDEVPDAIDEAELARLAIDDRQHDYTEANLKLRVFIKVVEDDLRLLAAFKIKYDAQTVAVAFVAYIGDALDLFVVQQ